MSLWRLAWTNLRRHLPRSCVGAAGIALGVAVMLSVVALLGGAVRMFERILRSDAEMVVFEKNVSDLFFSNVPVKVVDELEKHPAVEAAEPVLFGIVSAPDRPVVTCFGVKASSSRLRKANWLSGSLDDFREDQEDIVIGERAAAFLKVKHGDMAAIGRGQFRVAGVIRTENGFEDGGVFMPLAACQRFFHKDGVSSIITVSLREGRSSGEIKDWVAAEHAELTALENEEFSRTYSQFRILKATAWATGGLAFLLGGLSVLNTMLLSVFGRIRELAILRVCGFSRGQVAQLILGESLLVAALGVAAGILLSVVGLRLLAKLPALQGYLDPTLSWLALAAAVALAVVTGVAGALYPAYYASRLRPAEALRYE